MRILLMEENTLTVILASSVIYNSKDKVALVYELGMNGCTEVEVDKRKYERDIQMLCKEGYLDWSEYDSRYYENERNEN